jgi:hypothetical protein
VARYARFSDHGHRVCGRADRCPCVRAERAEAGEPGGHRCACDKPLFNETIDNNPGRVVIPGATQESLDGMPE